MTPGQPARSRRWRSTPRGKFSEARRRARHRGVAFELTFEAWWRIWQASGRWAQRGTRRDGYVMRRIGDDGPYSEGNVYIGTHEDNARESYGHSLAAYHGREPAPIIERPYADVPF